MTLDELKQVKAPFVVESVHDGREATITGFQYDPLLLLVSCAFFEGGGWCAVTDLLKHWRIKKVKGER